MLPRGKQQLHQPGPRPRVWELIGRSKPRTKKTAKRSYNHSQNSDTNPHTQKSINRTSLKTNAFVLLKTTPELRSQRHREKPTTWEPHSSARDKTHPRSGAQTQPRRRSRSRERRSPPRWFASRMQIWKCPNWKQLRRRSAEGRTSRRLHPAGSPWRQGTRGRWHAQGRG